MRRFFIDPRSITADTAFLSKSESQHIVSVLRMQPGEKVELFDGTGTLYQGELETISHDRVAVRLLSRDNEIQSCAAEVFLLQGLLKPKKMDLIVQKATELGVHAFQPLITRYTENRSNFMRQHDRWQRIMLEACKQCKRSVPMQIFMPVELAAVSSRPDGANLILWEGENKRQLDPRQLDDVTSVSLLIGPEGGFHEEEVAYARNIGFQSITLGKRILRAETATLTAVAIVQYFLGALE